MDCFPDTYASNLIADFERKRKEIAAIPIFNTQLMDLEDRLCLFVGQQRYQDGVRAHADPEKHGLRRDNLEVHVEGARYQCAFHKITNTYWAEAGRTFHGHEPIDPIQIRGSDHPRRRRLMMRPDEAAVPELLAARWVFITKVGGHFHFVGWLYGHEIMEIGHIDTPDPERPPCWCADEQSLRPSETWTGEEELPPDPEWSG
jgi:hypothetical protein